MAPSSRTLTESKEVARARDFLARLQASRGGAVLDEVPDASEPNGPASQATSVTNTSRVRQTFQPRSRKSTPVVPSATSGPIEARIVETVPEAAPANTFAKRRPLGSISWHNEETAEAGSIDALPSAVAKAFGCTPRRYRSLEELTDTVDALVQQTAFDRLVAGASARERSAHDCVQKLVDEGFEAATAAQAVQKAARYAIVDDARFAEAFIAGKIRSGWGRRRIERALEEQHGVRASDLPDYPERYYREEESEEDRARALLAKKPVPAKNPVEKLSRFLITRGFDTGCAFRLAKEHVQAREQELQDEETA